MDRRKRIMVVDSQRLISARNSDLTQALFRLTRSHRQIQSDYLEIIHRMAKAAEYRSPQTAGHIHRVSRYCEIIARSLVMPDDEVDVIVRACVLHDVGNVGVSARILQKPGPLTPDERTAMEQHTLIGADILSRSESPVLCAGEVIARSHHEKWDGSGYPFGLREEEIPLPGRICAVGDVFDTLTSTRPYRAALSFDDACRILLEGRGTHFDPLILDLFFENLEEVMAVHAEFGEPSPEFWLPAA